MSTPKHRTAPGISYFVTTKCWQSRAIFRVSEIAEIMMTILFHYRDSGAYLLHEFVIMPDHLHLLLTPSPTTSLEKAVQLIKGGSSHQIHKERNHRIEIWQQGFFDWTIRDFGDWQDKVDYIRMNPVRAKLVERPEEWPYCSASVKFTLDPMPDKYLRLSSGAKAPMTQSPAPGLKPRPPEEDGAPGPKGPTPVASTNVSGASGAKAPMTTVRTPGLKPRPPKEDGAPGPKGPTPFAPTNMSGASGAKALVEHPSAAPGLKPRPPKETSASEPAFGAPSVAAKAAKA